MESVSNPGLAILIQVLSNTYVEGRTDDFFEGLTQSRGGQAAPWCLGCYS
jgi:hypothetical protein